MGKNKNRGYGYGETLTGAASNVQLPDKVPCGRCEKTKGHHCYSKNRLNHLKTHAYKNSGFNAARTPYVNCMMCSGAAAQQLELDCIDCERTLPNTRFNKTQRRNPDHARCNACQQKRNQYEPGAASDDDDSGHDGSDGGSDDLGEGSSMGTRMSHLAVTDGNSYGGGVSLNGNSAASGQGYDSTIISRAPSASNRDVAPGSTTTNATNRSNWTSTTSTASQSNGLPAGIKQDAYRSINGAPSTRPNANSSSGGKFAKVRASDVALRNQAPSRANGRSRPTTTKPAPAPCTQDDDDIGVAPDDSDDDD